MNISHTLCYRLNSRTSDMPVRIHFPSKPISMTAHRISSFYTQPNKNVELKSCDSLKKLRLILTPIHIDRLKISELSHVFSRIHTAHQTNKTLYYIKKMMNYYQSLQPAVTKSEKFFLSNNKYRSLTTLARTKMYCTFNY